MDILKTVSHFKGIVFQLSCISTEITDFPPENFRSHSFEYVIPSSSKICLVKEDKIRLWDTGIYKSIFCCISSLNFSPFS